MQESRWLSDDQLRAWVHYLGAQTLVQRAIERHLHETAGISHAEYEILTRLDAAPDRRMRMGELAAVLFSPGSRLNYRITRLAGLGWVRREQHPTDRRGLYAVLTAEGAEFLHGVAPGYRRAVHESVVNPLTDDEFAELGRISRKLFQHHLGRGD
ncbi:MULTISPECIES: MarR family winged helix-turn-helix transcriptional regulator [Amycolatopsis]|uniref:MarR family transcriptional regulator n=1 Tax=Amycolatopsis tucumanensis TaxID=401106 RepID=A0ABP7JVL0_9PSEU|nr:MULTISPECIES: MarR family transcriptional regulator [Amycolatopsis]MCF6428195.1 MarR family transcriptional regulator [Amycolatopsis tucumanensis]